MTIYIVIVTKRPSRYLILKNVALFELYLTLILILVYFIIQKQNKIKGWDTNVTTTSSSSAWSVENEKLYTQIIRPTFTCVIHIWYSVYGILYSTSNLVGPMLTCKLFSWLTTYFIYWTYSTISIIIFFILYT